MKKNNRPADFIYRKNIDEMTLLLMRSHLFCVLRVLIYRRL